MHNCETKDISFLQLSIAHCTACPSVVLEESKATIETKASHIVGINMNGRYGVVSRHGGRDEDILYHVLASAYITTEIFIHAVLNVPEEVYRLFWPFSPA